MRDSSSGLFIGILVIYFCYLICSSFSYLLWSLTSSAGILILISCWTSCLYGGYVLYWGLTYAWACMHLAYVRRHNVPVPTGSGRYRVVSEPRFTPGVGNHLGQCLGSYQQYSQVQIHWSVSEFGVPATSTRIPWLWQFIPWLDCIPSFPLSTRTSDFLLVFFASSCFPSVGISSLPYFSISHSF